MGSLYRRKDSRFWWLAFVDAHGTPRGVSSRTADEAVAKRRLAQLEKQVRAEREAGGPKGPMTLRKWAGVWLKRRRDSGDFSAHLADERRWSRWVSRRPLADMLLVDIRPSHLKEHMLWVRKENGKYKRPLAPRSQLRVYGLLRLMFADAVADDLLTASPCVLRARRKELPKAIDASPTWRANAVFKRGEVERILSAKGIPQWRQIFYAALFLTGAREGELFVRRVGDYDRSFEPRGRLLLSDTKTDVTREVPVHPTLARFLAEWLLSGWEQLLGRKPRADDLLFPTSAGTQRNQPATLRQFHGDLVALGLRKRRVHDARRSFISLTMADGASKDLLRYVTHGPDGTVFGDYLTPPWESLCGEVDKLRLSLKGVSSVSTASLRKRKQSKNPNE